MGYRVKHPDKYIESRGAVYGLKSNSGKKTTTGTGAQPKGDEKELDAVAHSQYRSGVGKLQFLKKNRFDMSYAVKGAAHDLARPRTHSEANLKHLLKYLFDDERL